MFYFSQRAIQPRIEELSYTSEFDEIPMEVQQLFQRGKGRGFQRGRGKGRGGFIANPNVIVIPTVPMEGEEASKTKDNKTFFLRPQDKWANTETNGACSSSKPKGILLCKLEFFSFSTPRFAA